MVVASHLSCDQAQAPMDTVAAQSLVESLMDPPRISSSGLGLLLPMDKPGIRSGKKSVSNPSP